MEKDSDDKELCERKVIFTIGEAFVWIQKSIVSTIVCAYKNIDAHLCR